jgi:cytosine/adenosine deaminase-related metal-dependent hydrolase
VAEHDIVLTGGRVIDPASGVDAVLNVGITGRRIASVSAEPLHGRIVVDVGGHVVSPGFIDLHSHGQGIPEQRLQALDGVTTALELEAGVLPVDAAYARAAAEGRPIHYGFSTSWALARMSVVGGLEVSGELGEFLHHIGDPAWQPPATGRQIGQMIDLLEADLAAGALGIGVLIGYAQDADVDEYLAVAGLAAGAGVPTYTHARDLVEWRPEGKIDGATEIVQAAAATGAHMHYCHINSTSGRQIDRVQTLVERTRTEGATVTAEAYPYAAGMTGIGAGFLSPERLAQRGAAPDAITYVPTGERVASAERLIELRDSDPGGLAFVEFLREDSPEDFKFIEQGFSAPATAIASDAMPIHWADGTPDPYVWPLPPGGVTHPRSAGTFSRTLRLARDRELMTLTDTIARCTLLPAQVLESVTPAMRLKARIQSGCDADIVVFDPDNVTDRATYTDTLRPSAGIAHVLVDGTFVVRNGSLVVDALPGRPLRAGGVD